MNQRGVPLCLTEEVIAGRRVKMVLPLLLHYGEHIVVKGPDVIPLTPLDSVPGSLCRATNGEMVFPAKVTGEYIGRISKIVKKKDF